MCISFGLYVLVCICIKRHSEFEVKGVRKVTIFNFLVLVCCIKRHLEFEARGVRKATIVFTFLILVKFFNQVCMNSLSWCCIKRHLEFEAKGVRKAF